MRRGRRTIRLRNLDQEWWRAGPVRKRDVLEYYEQVAPVLLRHLRGRPFTLKQHYNGPRSPFRWLKDAPAELPPWVPVVPLPAKSRGGELVRYAVVDDVLTLLWLVDYGCVDLHVWSSRADKPERPDYVLFDLDPAGVGFAEVARAAHLLRDALALLGLESVVATTGGEGLHVRVPIARRHTYAQARQFATVVADALERSSGGLVTTERALARRHGVFADTKMNGHGQQVVAVYSVRPREVPAVATPLRWDELDASLDPRAFTMDAVLDRVRRHGDLHAPALRGRQSLGPALSRVR